MKQIKSFTSPNSKEWLSYLLSYFINIKSIDDNIEALRIALCSQNDFSPKQLFEYLDKRNKDFLLLNDFVQFLNELQIPFKEKYLRKFIHNFDKDSDFSLNLEEFLGIITPKKNDGLKQKVLSNLNNYTIITKDTKNIFGKILCEELELVHNCIKTAKICQRSLGFTCYESFIEIAGNDKYINEKHLYNFLQRNNINISNNDMHQLMFRLDADDDGRISFNEFEEIFFPTKEGDLNYKENNSPEKNYILSSTNSQRLKQEFPNKSTKNSNNIIYDYISAQNQNSFLDINNSSNNNLKNIIVEDNMKPQSTSNIMRGKNFTFKYQDDQDDKENINVNKTFYKKTQKIITGYNRSPVLDDDSDIKQVTYITELNDNDNNFTSTFNKASNYVSPSKVFNNNASYKSPKIKDTYKPLHYDYSSYSKEEGDEYHKINKIRQSAKTDSNRNYRANKNLAIDTNNNIETKNKSMIKLCCGCSINDPICTCPSDANYDNCDCPKKQILTMKY